MYHLLLHQFASLDDPLVVVQSPRHCLFAYPAFALRVFRNGLPFTSETEIQNHCMKRVCVFCGSSPGSRPEYGAAAEEMAAELVRRNISLVYGGGNVGLMGIIADAVLRAGGEV